MVHRNMKLERCAGGPVDSEPARIAWAMDVTADRACNKGATAR